MSKISLCMIVGNVEDYIERCLSSFAPIADEICVVRAIGNAAPDKTLDIARDEFGAVVAEYRNAPEHDWPHIDSFAAARQMSFDLATGDYCFWCDSDDVLESGAEVVRELADRGGYPAFVFPYKIFSKGLVVPRERMMLKDSGKWQFAVHECFDFHIKPVQGVEDNRVVVTHLPHANKTGSNDRNLRILKSIPPEQMTTGLKYHLHLELALSGDVPASVEAAKEVLAAPDLGKPERYETFLNLAQLAIDQPAEKEALLHGAYKADPCRREALGLLALHAMDHGRKDLALAYARQMQATLKPSCVDWNDRDAMYSWVGDDIYSQALRVNRQFLEAENVRQKALEVAGGPTIALVHATRGRYEQAARARKTWLDLADHPEQIEHLFVIDEDDRESDPLRRMHHALVPPGGGCVAAWNFGAHNTFAPIIVQMSDDWTPPAKWDRLIIERLIGKSGDVKELAKPKVLAVSDGFRKDKLLCMAIMTRHYWGLDYFMFHPWFKGVYSDNWFTKQAYERGCVVEARDLLFTHNHPLVNGDVEVDATYAEQNSPARYLEGQTVMGLLEQRNDWSTIPGFFNYWNFYGWIVSQLKDGDSVVEVGCWLGRSIVYFAQECRRQNKKVKIYAVDHFKGESNQKEHEATVALCGGSLKDSFIENLKRCGVYDDITILDGDSAGMADGIKDGSLAFCFIDAAHDYESVKRDVSAWLPKVKREGVIAGHDAAWHEVIKAVDELLPGNRKTGDVWTWRIE